MTRKERAAYLNQLIIPDLFDNSQEACELRIKQDMALRETIEELEQEPCEDAISRQAVIDSLKRASDIAVSCGTVDKEENKHHLPELIQWIEGFPSVVRENRTAEKVGQWIEHKTDDDRSWLECPICHIKKQYPITNYCPKCGSRNTEKDILDEDGWVW